MPRSISIGVRTGSGITFIASDGEAASAAWKNPTLGRVRMEDESDLFDLRCNLPEYLQPFAAYGVLEIGESSGVAAGLSQTGDEATADRVADKHEDDRYAAGFLP